MTDKIDVVRREKKSIYDQFETLGEDMSGTADWTYGEFREDIKACVEKAKKISRAKKIFRDGSACPGMDHF